MNVKKPVSILQEMMVKKGLVPTYQLIHNGGGTHQNVFTYRVECDGFIATGTGRCKKEARHEAATAMLETIAKHNSFPQLPASPCDSPVRTPLPITIPECPKPPIDVPFRNLVGELQDLCFSNNLEDPKYKEISGVGPPHARIFTVQCIVSTFVEEGVSTTKKRAKHEAARKMLNRITGVVSEDSCTLDLECKENAKKELVASEIAMARYPELSVNYNTEMLKSKVNWGLKVINYHKKLSESFDSENKDNLLVPLKDLLIRIEEYRNDLCEENLKQLYKEFDGMLKSRDIQFCESSIKPSTSTANFILGIQLNTAPDIFEIGTGKSEFEAKLSALQNILNSMKLFLE